MYTNHCEFTKEEATFMMKNASCDSIYQILEKEIVNLEIKPGQTLSENSLCQRFSVSRTPIRSVLQRLQQNRFVQILPQKGTIVTPINLEIATQFIYQRVAVETMVFRDFVRICSPTDIAKVSYAFQIMEQIAAASDESSDFNMEKFLAADMQMHEIWFHATGKMFLWKNLTRPQADYSRFIRLDMVGAKNVPDVIKEHKEMLNILESKNTDSIESLISQHLYGGVRRLGGQLFSEQYSCYFLSEEN